MQLRIKLLITIFFGYLLLAMNSCGSKEHSPHNRTPSGQEEVGALSNQPKPDKNKILFFGDSLMAGPDIDPTERFPEKIQEKLKSIKSNWLVVNAGVTGNTTEDALDRLDALLTNDTAVVFICLGGNDFIKGRVFSEVERDLDKIVSKAKSPSRKVILAGISGNGLIASVGNTAGDLVSDRDPKKYTKLFQSLADKYDLPLYANLYDSIPEASVLENASGKLFDPDYMIDKVHPNAKGHKLIADKIYDFIIPSLEEAANL